MSHTKENEKTDHLIDDQIIEQILDDAKPYLKKSLQDWMINQSIDIQRKYNDDLFKLSFNEFINLSAQEQRNWRHQILREKKNWLLNKLVTKKAEWLLILGGKIEIASPSINELPTKEKIYGLAQSKGFAPFIFIKDPLIEESESKIGLIDWSILKNNDYYPTIDIFIGANYLNDNDLIDSKNEVIADFDTGSPIIVLDQKQLKNRNISFDEEIEISQVHLGMTYDFFLPEIKIGLRTMSNSVKSKTFRVRSVINWNDSPFCRVNPNRKGLVGRNLLIEMKLHVILKGDAKTTQILQ